MPKAKGGTDDPSNLIALTAREHFIAHWILWRAYRDRQTCDAFWLMKHTRGVNINSRTYQRLKEDRAEIWRKRMTEKNPMDDPDIRQRQSEGLKNRWKENPEIVAARGKKIAAALRGGTQTEESNRKRRETLAGRYIPPVSCLVCRSVGGVPTMTRWHLRGCTK